MKSPYIETTSTSVKAQITGKAVNGWDCIYQATHETCNFSVGGDGLTQVEYNYEYTGD
jgi:hypothetical protein